jgi:hypothetical protein
VTGALPAQAGGKPNEERFTVEARVGQQGTLTRIWAKRGSRPREPLDRRYQWAYLFGAICPERCLGVAINMPEVNTQAMNEHLAEISRRDLHGGPPVPPSWFSMPGLAHFAAPEVTGHIVLLVLPAYSPELNPMENVWEFLRGEFLSRRIWDTYDGVLDAWQDAWNRLMRMPECIASMTTATGPIQSPDQTLGTMRISFGPLFGF